MARNALVQVLEVWQTWVGMNGMSNEGFRGQAQAFIKALHARLKQGGKRKGKGMSGHARAWNTVSDCSCLAVKSLHGQLCLP